VFLQPIVTQVVPLKGFDRADHYHQDYAPHNPDNTYIKVCDPPKIKALKEELPQLFVDYHGEWPGAV
jgi:peptide-methionine (S)-S-oxide reductase